MITGNVVNCMTGKVPIAEHPLFGKVWKTYADNYNRLSEALKDAGIDAEMLKAVIESAKKVEQLGYIVAYQWGYEDCLKQYQHCVAPEVYGA